MGCEKKAARSATTHTPCFALKVVLHLPSKDRFANHAKILSIKVKKKKMKSGSAY
jgi:hypothetical protein